MQYLYVILTFDGMVEDIKQFDRDNVEAAEQLFVDHMQEHIWNFGDYDNDDIEACIENGYEGWGGNSVQLHWND